jgi:hypothetical protein
MMTVRIRMCGRRAALSAHCLQTSPAMSRAPGIMSQFRIAE